MDPKQSNRPWILRPRGEGFRADVAWAVAVLAGAALGALLFDAWTAFVGSVIGVLLVVAVRAISRRVRRRR